MGNIRLMLGDCLDRMDDIDSNSVDMVISDIPYGTTKCRWDTVINLDLMWDKLLRITKDNAAIVLTAQTPFDKVLGCSNIGMLKYEWIWEKTSATGHLNAKKMPMKAHENVLIFYKRLPTYNPQKTTGHRPVNSFTKRDDSDGECYGRTKMSKGGGNTDRYPRSVQVFSSDKQRLSLHSAQKPEALSDYFIKTYSNTGDTVADIAMGSGTFGVSAIKNGRSFIGIEKDRDIFGTAASRINSVLCQTN